MNHFSLQKLTENTPIIFLALATFLLGSVVFISRYFTPNNYLTAAVAVIGSGPFVGNEAFVTHTDRIPNFAKNFTIATQQSGKWTDPNTWDKSRIPAPTDIVLIRHNISYDMFNGDVDTIGIDANGALRFSSIANTSLKVVTILIMPNGIFEIGTQENPIPQNISAEIIIKDKPLDLNDDGVGVYDPAQFGNGIIAINGTWKTYGAIKSPTWIRLSKEPKAGDTTLVLESPVSGWGSGDRLFLPDTRLVRSDVNYTPQWEFLSVQSVSGNTITLVAPLKYTHLGARDPDGKLEFLPHVANLSRNIVIRSENPKGVRGHTLATERSVLDLHYTNFRDIGRTSFKPLSNVKMDITTGVVQNVGTNQGARYPVHPHHLVGPENLPENTPQFTIFGNSVEGGLDVFDTPKWGIVVHASHYGLIKQNVVVNAKGAGIVTEDGDETANVFEENFAAGAIGSNEAPYGRSDTLDFGHEGAGFWFRSHDNVVRNNVAANVTRPGFAFVAIDVPVRASSETSPPLIRKPAFKGAMPSEDGGFILSQPNALPMREFDTNEAYGAMETGLLLWEIGSRKTSGTEFILPDAKESVFKNMIVWHVWESGFFPRTTDKVTLDHLVVRGDNGRGNIGISFRDGRIVRNLKIRNADIQGEKIGIHTPDKFDFSQNKGGGNAPIIIEDSYFRNSEKNIQVPTMGVLDNVSTTTPDKGPEDLLPREIIIRNTRFSPMGKKALKAISMEAQTAAVGSHRPNLVQLDSIKVFDYNGDPAADFQVYYKEQAPDFVIPQTTNTLWASPEPGLTNKEAFAKYGIAVAGAIAPCLDSTTHPEIIGFVCPISTFPTTSPGEGSTPPPTETKDTTPPSVSIVHPAEDGAILSGTSKFTVSASDNVSVSGVQFIVDENIFADDATSPYEVEFDTTKVSNSIHTLEAKVRDASGNSASAKRTFNVNNVQATPISPPSSEPPTINKFSLGDRVEVVTGDGTSLIIREQPEGSATVLGTQKEGALGTVIEGPVNVFPTWWKVNFDLLPDGWGAEDFLVKSAVSTTPPPTETNPPPPDVPLTSLEITVPQGVKLISSAGKFSIGDQVKVSAGQGGNLNVRTLDQVVLGQQPTGALGEVTGGPFYFDGIIWWEMDYQTGVDGWSAESFLEKTQSATSPPASLQVGIIIPAGVQLIER